MNQQIFRKWSKALKEMPSLHPWTKDSEDFYLASLEAISDKEAITVLPMLGQRFHLRPTPKELLDLVESLRQGQMGTLPPEPPPGPRDAYLAHRLVPLGAAIASWHAQHPGRPFPESEDDRVKRAGREEWEAMFPDQPFPYARKESA